MEDRVQAGSAGRGSGIPRPGSRLPMPKSTSIRPSPSRENLNGGGEARIPRLRPSASRDRLGTAPPTTRLRNNGLPAIALTAKSTKQIPSLPQTRPVSSLPLVGSVRLPKRNDNGPSKQLRDRMMTVPEQKPRDPQVSNLPGIRRMASAQWVSSSQSRQSSNSDKSHDDTSSDLPSQTSPNAVDDNSASDATIRAKPAKSRPSLAERTIETLSLLPSSPSLKGKTSNSNFFDPESYNNRSISRPGSSRSRPGSSHQSDASSRPSSRVAFTRPGSSSGPGQDSHMPSFRSSSNTYRSTLAPVQNTPVRGRTMKSIPTPSFTTTPGRGNIPSPSSIRLRRSRTPSPEKRQHDAVTPKYGSKTMSTRTLKPRASVNGLFKKPSLPVMRQAAVSEIPHKTSAASRRSSLASGEDVIFSTASSTSMPTTVDPGETSQAAASRKSSEVLRDMIAKAKASKRAASSLQVSAQVTSSQPLKSPVVPTDTTFDFGLPDDPFNMNRDANSTAKFIQSRLALARTSGRLNIAALGLKEIPDEIMKMYDLGSVGTHDGSWAESVDLTRFVAADNELETIAESVFPDVDPQDMANDDDNEARGNIFGGLETLDLHGNMLIALPAGLRRLTLLTSLNLSANRLANNCLEIVSQITQLRDLKLGGNLLWGTLEPCFSRLINLEILDLHGNKLQHLPQSFSELQRLRILNISENSFESLPFGVLSRLPLKDISARKNKLTGVLIDDDVETLASLQNLDVSSNQLTSLVRSNGVIAMPALTRLCVSMNRLTSLPDVTSWVKLLTLTADENNINTFPDGFTSLETLASADFSSNDIRTVPAEIARMDKLALLRLSGNPLRDKKFVAASTEELKEALAARLEPPPMAPILDNEGPIAEALTSNETSPVETAFYNAATGAHESEDRDDENRTDTDDFATPPTSARASPVRHRSSSPSWPVKSGGVLDRSNTQSASLHPVVCSKLANDHTIREIQLHHNLFTALPDSLSFFTDSLTSLSLSHNQLVGESYLGNGENLDLPVLKELNLSSNHITGLTPLVNHLRAPLLQKLDVSLNRITSLPAGGEKGRLLRDVFPNLTVLLIANNHLADLDPDAVRGMNIVNAANNDIAHLNPRLGLLGGVGGLEKLVVSGNRFRVPRFNVLDRGTDATLRWLRGRVPVAEMAAWKDDGEPNMEDLD